MGRSTWGSKSLRYGDCWELRWSANGERMREYFHGTEKQADARLAELRLIYEGALTNPDITVDAYFKTKFVEYIKRDLAPTTWPGYMDVYKRYVQQTFGNVKLRDVGPKKIQAWLMTLTKSNAKHAKAVLSSLLSYAVVDEIIDTNPARNRYRYPKTTTGRKVDGAIFTREEMEEIAKRCVGEFWEGAFIVAGFGGASPHEAYGVQLDMVERVEVERHVFAVVRLMHGVHHIKGGIHIRWNELKNEYRPRDLVIESPQAEQLLEFVEAEKAKGHTWICDDGFGMPVDPNNANTAFRRWFEGQPLVYHPFKQLRNSYATMRLDQGIDGSMVAKMIGNEVRGTTEKHYEKPDYSNFINAILQSSRKTNEKHAE